MNILVIQHKMIGDVLTTSLLFELLKNLYPNANLHYLINENTSPVIAGNPFIDKLWLRSKTTDGHYFLTRQQTDALKKVSFDIVIDVYAKIGSATMATFLKPKMSISYRKWYTRFRYKITVKPLRESLKDEGLAITNRVLLLETLGHKIEKIPAPKIYLKESEIEQAKSMLANAGLDSKKPLFMISVLGSGVDKTYPLKYMAKVLDMLVNTTNAKLLFNYIPSQRLQVDALLAYCEPSTKANIHDTVYGKSLREFMALTTQCDALIGNEGGAINMAKALGVPTYAIYAPWILKSAWNSYETSGNHRSIHLQDVKPELYKKHPKKYKNKISEYYQLFTPDFVISDLQEFLEHHQFLASKP